MMIGDDEINAQTSRRVGGCKSSNTGIYADNQPNSVRRGTLDDFVPHAITFADAMRHMEIGASAAKLDCGFQDHDGGRTVYVVVAINENLLFTSQSRGQTFDGSFHARHRVG